MGSLLLLLRDAGCNRLRRNLPLFLCVRAMARSRMPVVQTPQVPEVADMAARGRRGARFRHHGRPQIGCLWCTGHCRRCFMDMVIPCPSIYGPILCVVPAREVIADATAPALMQVVLVSRNADATSTHGKQCISWSFVGSRRICGHPLVALWCISTAK